MPDWDLKAVADALVSDPTPRVHSAYGHGLRYPLGVEETADLELYPDSGVVRYSSESTHLAFFGEDAPSVNGETVLFNSTTPSEHRTIMIGWQGEVIVAITPRQTSESARRTIEDWQTQHATPLSEQVAPWEQEPAAQTPSADSSDEKEHGERQPRVRITGNLARDVQVVESEKGTTVRFAVGEHAGDDTVWHNCYATKQYAERIRDGNFKRGEEVRVVGTRQENGDGPKIYVYAVKRTTEEGRGVQAPNAADR